MRNNYTRYPNNNYNRQQRNYVNHNYRIRIEYCQYCGLIPHENMESNNHQCVGNIGEYRHVFVTSDRSVRCNYCGATPTYYGTQCYSNNAKGSCFKSANKNRHQFSPFQQNN